MSLSTPGPGASVAFCRLQKARFQRFACCCNAAFVGHSLTTALYVELLRKFSAQYPVICGQAAVCKAETWRSIGLMRSGGQTTVIQRILERRAQQPPAIQDDTTATIAVMLRVLPPPRALLAIADSVVRTQIERFISAEVLDFQAAADEREALSLFTAEFRPVVITDSLELIRKLREIGRAHV